MRKIGPCLLVLLCAAAGRPNVPTSKWQQLWFAEYDVYSAQTHRQPALFFFEGRATAAARGDDIRVISRIESGTRPFDIYRQGSAYFADSMPLFAPSHETTSVRGGEYDCDATVEGSGYAVACKSNYRGVTLRSFYRPQSGIAWFEYFCGYPERVCRFEFARGKGFLRSEFLRTLEQHGSVRMGKPPRPKLTQ